MTLLDRFRTTPRQKHPDPAIRLANVAEIPLDERDVIEAIAREDEDARVRRAAVAKLMDAPALASIARDDRDDGVREQAMAMLRDIALDAFEGVTEAESLGAVDAIADVKVLAQIAKTSLREAIGRRALSRISDGHALGAIARQASLEVVRVEAFGALPDASEALGIAVNGEFKDTAVAAVDRLTERRDLEQVIARAKNKAAVKRARTLLRGLDMQTTETELPPPGIPVDGNGIERQVILQRLARAAAFDTAALVEESLREATSAWAALDPDSEPDAGLVEQFRTASARIQERLDQLRADEARQGEAAEEAARRAEAAGAADRARAEDDQRRADEQTAKDAERRRARLTELSTEADEASRDADLASARRRLAIVRTEWKDLAAHGVDPDQAALVEKAEAAVKSRTEEARAVDARARRDALNRMHQLLGRVEPLGARADLLLKPVERALRDIRAALGDVPPLPSKQDYDEVVRRLKAVQGELTPKAQELRVTAEWQQWANVGIQERLCGQMEALRALEDTDALVARIRELQQEWRKAADVPRAQGEILWKRFKALHDELWARCEAHFVAEATVRAENLAKKTALAERAEGLAVSTSWIQTAEALKQLQGEWKTIGPVTRGQEKAVWDRFRSACDRFFARRHDDLVQRKTMWAENLAKKDALCARAEELAESTDWDQAARAIRGLQADWKAIGPVKKSRSEAIWTRFRGACDKFFERYAHRHDTALAERLAARAALCEELEALGGPDETPADAAVEPPANLIATLRGLRGRWQQEVAARRVDREHAAELDRRFAAASERVIARWPSVFNNTEFDRDANRKRMEALVTRVEALAASLSSGTAAGDPGESSATRLAAMLKEALAANTIGGRAESDSRLRAAQEEVRQAQLAWSRLGPVADDARRRLAERFDKACRKISEKK